MINGISAMDVQTHPSRTIRTWSDPRTAENR